MKLREIAEIAGGSIIGNPDIDITGVSGIKDARKGSITFLSDKKYLPFLYGTEASAVIVAEEIGGLTASMLVVENPYLAFAKTLEAFYKRPHEPAGVSAGAYVGAGVKLGLDVSIYPMAYVSSNVSIGNRVSIYPHVYIGENVSVGDGSVIYPNVTIRENVKIGGNVIIHPGAVIGSDGFGYVQDGERHYKIPQVGGVVIEDDVEIGANVTIDRATVGYTNIGRGTKIDNLAQIAHNVKIGSHCLIVSQVGIAGSAELGNRVLLGGQAGIGDHVRIADGVAVGAKSGVVNNLERGTYTGMPAIPHNKWLRSQSIYSKLPELLKRLRDLEKKVKKED